MTRNVAQGVVGAAGNVNATQLGSEVKTCEECGGPIGNERSKLAKTCSNSCQRRRKVRKVMEYKKTYLLRPGPKAKEQLRRKQYNKQYITREYVKRRKAEWQMNYMRTPEAKRKRVAFERRREAAKALTMLAKGIALGSDVQSRELKGETNG